MNNLIAVVTCWRNEIGPQVIRETWGKDSPIPIRFFYGGNPRRALYSDEVVVNAPDTYAGLAAKMKEIFRWCSSCDYILKCDDDAYVVPNRVRFGTDHAGLLTPQGYIHGGAGYILSRRSLSILAGSEITSISEDKWVSDTLYQHGISPQNNPEHIYQRRVFKDPLPPEPTKDNNLAVVAEYAPQEVYAVHKRFLYGVRPDPRTMTPQEVMQDIRRNNELGHRLG